jgi:hypothetical protein
MVCFLCTVTVVHLCISVKRMQTLKDIIKVVMSEHQIFEFCHNRGAQKIDIIRKSGTLRHTRLVYPPIKMCKSGSRLQFLSFTRLLPLHKSALYLFQSHYFISAYLHLCVLDSAKVAIFFCSFGVVFLSTFYHNYNVQHFSS